MKTKDLLYLLISILVFGCGDGSTPTIDPNGSEVQSWELQALSDTPETRSAILAASPRSSCPHNEVFLAMDNEDWGIVNGSPYNLAAQDVVHIGEDCFFQSYACGTLGYIISGGESTTFGMVRVMMLGHLFPHPTCYRLGEQLCAYVHDGSNTLRLDCQLVTPLSGPFTP